jgi:glutamyl-tRNA reductase
LPEADILITSTAATEPVVTTKQIAAAIKARKRKPIFACDIAVPRDIEASAGELDDFYLYTIDDLDKVILEGQGNREAAAIEAHRLLDDEIRRYAAIERSKQVAPIIAELRDSHEAIRKQIAKKALKRMRRGESAEDAIEFATASLMKKILHQPSVVLRQAGEASDIALIESARRLFDLDKD